MTKKYSTKRALIASILTLCMCFTMLIGTTFAWFTDSVTSGGNMIQTGTLDVSMGWAEGTEDPANVTYTDASAGAIFQSDLWEPGYVEARHIKIANEGTLALKYKLVVVANGEVSDLSDVIDVYYFDPAEQLVSSDALVDANKIGNLTNVLASFETTAAGTLEAGKNHTVTIALKMQETAGNEYQDKSIGSDFSIVLVATQATSEDDSFGNGYDADAEYPVNIIVSKPVTVDSSNKLSEDVNINYTDDSSTVSSVTVTVPAGAQLDAGAEKLVLSVKEADGVDPTVQITSNQAAKTYNISLEGLASDNDEEIEVVLNIEKGLVDVQLYHKDALVPDATYDPVTGKLSFKTKGFSPFTVVSATKLFVAGDGTAENPYIIEKPEDMLNISKYYHEYKYYKVADGVETLDMTGIGKLRLNGSFDGNGVTINNLTTALFENVGKVGVEQDIKISNLTANVNTTDGRAFVRNVINPGTTTFANVALHGYIEGQYNMGSFYNYGAANASGCEGANYTVCFVNATSDVTLVCISGNSIGGMLGHGYEGANYKLSINMDDASKYTGKMYTTGTATCYQVMAMCSHATYVLNGVETSRYDDKYSSTKLTLAGPSAQADGYYVVPVDGVDHYVVSLEAQLTAYDKNGVKLANQAGLTWSLGKETLTSGFDAKIFDLIQSAEIVNDKDIKIGYELDNGALKVYTGRDWNFASGWITLNVTQYDAEGNILATGNVRVHTFVEPDWVSTADELKAAIEAGNNVTLLSDINLNADAITVKKDLVLDLNGYTLSGVCNKSQGYLLMVNNGVTMDVKDSSVAQSGKITYAEGSSNVGWTIDLEGTLNLYSGTIELTGESWSIGYAVDVRPNAWGTNYTQSTVFHMYGGKIVSSDGAIRVASSSSDSYGNISAEFIMENGEIDATWDGIFVQQSNAAYDTLSVTLNGGKVRSALSPIRVYGPLATSVNSGAEKPMTINVANGVELAVNGEIDTSRVWYLNGKIVLGGGMTIDELTKYASINVK